MSRAGHCGRCSLVSDRDPCECCAFELAGGRWPLAPSPHDLVKARDVAGLIDEFRPGGAHQYSSMALERRRPPLAPWHNPDLPMRGPGSVTLVSWSRRER